MFSEVDIKDQLSRLSSNHRTGGDKLLSEARRILNNDLFTDVKVLDHLGNYNRASEFADEEILNHELVFTLDEIKQICVTYRLKFLDAKVLRSALPYEAVLSIMDFNTRFGKTVSEFKILSQAEWFGKKDVSKGALVFVKTNHNNFYLVHSWGTRLSWHRKFMYWPMRHFENLFVSIIISTLIITLSLPIGLITLDPNAQYWSGYRAAAFFHLFIFNMGVTAYTTFAFAKNFSSTVWDREQDFD